MAVCIAGMHRSGTSMVTKLLKVSGLYLGRDEDMLPANPTNPEGHWEHEGIVAINEELLAAYGGGWDFPPDFSLEADPERVQALTARARTELAHFAGREPWGWKDPRTSLTLPFWRPLVGPMRVVISVRNPLEVAWSLRQRNGSTLAFGLALWQAYNAALMHATTRAERVVTHYGRYLSDPVAECRRVGAAVGLTLPDDAVLPLRQSLKPELRHSQYRFADLVTVGVAPAIRALYHELCCEADAADEGAGADGPPLDVPGRGGKQASDALGHFDLPAAERLRSRA